MQDVAESDVKIIQQIIMKKSASLMRNLFRRKESTSHISVLGVSVDWG